jgi:hypothetical protein
VSKSWAEEQAISIGAAVRDLRGKRTGQWLSDETERIGHRVPRTTISELESGKRKSVSTAELCLLAWALRVPPIRLLYPNLPDGRVDVVPGERWTAIQAASWFSGDLTFAPVMTADAKQEDLKKATDLFRGQRLVERSRRRIELQERIKSFAKLVADLRASDDPTSADHFAKEIAAARKEIDAIEAELRQTEGAVVGDGG